MCSDFSQDRPADAVRSSPTNIIHKECNLIAFPGNKTFKWTLTLFKFESEASALISCSAFLSDRFVALYSQQKFTLLKSDVLLQVHQKPPRKFSPYIRFTFNKHLWLSCSLLSRRAGLSAQFLFLQACVQSSAQN